MENTVYDLLKKHKIYNGNRHTGDIGVEIETEVKTPYDYPKLKFWNCTRDGSLRNYGVEYVLKAPMSVKEFDQALEEFSECDKKFKFDKDSISTSVHVHLNMLNETYMTVVNLLTTYALTENLLIRYSGPDRLSNLFCLPMCDAEAVVTNIKSMIKSIGRNYYIKSVQSIDQVKYGAVNCAPLTSLGTIEFRSFRGETDVNVIRNWVNILMSMKTFSAQKGLDPVRIMELHRDLGTQEFMSMVFGTYASELRFTDADSLVKKNLLYGADIASCMKTWDGFGVPKIKKVYREKVKPYLDGISQELFSTDYDTLDYPRRLVTTEMYHRRNINMRIVDANSDT